MGYSLQYLANHPDVFAALEDEWRDRQLDQYLEAQATEPFELPYSDGYRYCRDCPRPSFCAHNERVCDDTS